MTNVVRHSGARCCTVRVYADRVEVSDDGRGPSTPDATGSGLVGLRERAGRLGAAVTVGRRPGGDGFLLRVHAPGETR